MPSAAAGAQPFLVEVRGYACYTRVHEKQGKWQRALVHPAGARLILRVCRTVQLLICARLIVCNNMGKDRVLLMKLDFPDMPASVVTFAGIITSSAVSNDVAVKSIYPLEKELPCG